MNKKIIVDICGADKAPQIMVKGAVEALQGQDEFDLIIAGPKDVIEEALTNEDESIKGRAEILAAEEAVTNHDNPQFLIKGKNETSMVKALAALKEREDAVAMVSPGSTGCLMVGSIFRLGIFKGLMQPALSSALWNINGGYFALVDCGANVNPKAKDLKDYARMGSAFMEAMNGVASPRVALMNVGREEGKGNDLAKEAFDLLKADDTINFIGNIEGCDVLLDEADVIVCDGFTGNVILKNLEATGKVAAKMMGDPEKVVHFFDYTSLGGATFLGTKKLIVKAHGAANSDTMKNCIDQAWKLAKGGFNEKMAARMS